MAGKAAKKKPYGPRDRVLAVHPVTGEQYGVSGRAFDTGFAPRGFEAVSYEDGKQFEKTAAEEAAAEPEGSVPGEAGLGVSTGDGDEEED